MSDTAFDASNFSELTRRGIEFYDENLKHLLEPGHNGAFVAIEPYSGRYFVHESETQALLDARAAMPERKFYLARVGSQYTHRIGGSWLRKKA